MIERFQIQDIASQDGSGIRYRALDTGTGEMVEIHRFFPFGLEGGEGGGLEPNEAEEYRRGVVDLAGLDHPGLRRVLAGDCDPVDGLPYLVSEWSGGERLAALLERGVLESGAAVAVIEEALRVSAAVSAKLGSEALWVETAPEQICIAGGVDGGEVVFGFAAIPWLVGGGGRGTLMPLAVLAEEMMGWRGRLVAPGRGGGLAAWIKWVRASAGNVSLAESHRVLQEMTGRGETGDPEFAAGLVAPPEASLAGTPSGQAMPRTRRGVAIASPEIPKPGKKSRRWPVILALLLAIGGLGSWAFFRPGGLSGVKPADMPVLGPLDLDKAASNFRREATVEGTVRDVLAFPGDSAVYLDLDTAGTIRKIGVRVATGGNPQLLDDLKKRWTGKPVRVTGTLRPGESGLPFLETEPGAIRDNP